LELLHAGRYNFFTDVLENLSIIDS